MNKRELNLCTSSSAGSSDKCLCIATCDYAMGVAHRNWFETLRNDNSYDCRSLGLQGSASMLVLLAVHWCRLDKTNKN